MRFRLALAAALVAAATMLAGCGGGSNAPTTPGTAVPSGTGSITGSGAEALKAVVQKFDAATFTATYSLSGSPSDGLGSGQLVLEKDGPNRIRIDFTTTQGGVSTTITFIDSGAISVFCLPDAAELSSLLGVAPGQGVCVKNDPGDAANPISGLAASLTDFTGQNVKVVGTSTRSVAGVDGSCYKTQNSGTNSVTTTCFNINGAILYAQTKGAAGSTLEAQSVSSSVEPAAFTPPYDVRELPTPPAAGATP